MGYLCVCLRMKNLLLVACLCGLAVFASCKKKDDPLPTPNPTPGSNTINLVSRTWKMTYSVVPAPGIPDSNGGFIISLYDSMLSCTKDDLLTFTKLAAYSQTEGDTRCRPSSSGIIETGTWSFVNNEAGISRKHTVTVVSGTGTTTQTLELIASLDSITETRMRLTYPLKVNDVTYQVSTGYVGL